MPWNVSPLYVSTSMTPASAPAPWVAEAGPRTTLTVRMSPSNGRARSLSAPSNIRLFIVTSVHLVEVLVIPVADDSPKSEMGLVGVMQEELRVGHVNLQQLIQVSGA